MYYIAPNKKFTPVYLCTKKQLLNFIKPRYSFSFYTFFYLLTSKFYVMKNLLFFTFSVFFVFVVKQSFSQIVTPTNEVCPEETIEYNFDSSISGNQAFGISYGKFIVDDSLYHIAPWSTVIDSTFIILNVDSTNTINIKWGNDSHTGTIYWYEVNANPAPSQDFEISIVDEPSIITADTIVLNGQCIFSIKVREWNADDNYITYTKSSNISYSTEDVDASGYDFGGFVDRIYYFQITGSQNGWVKFKSHSENNSCSNESREINVNIARKLNIPIISGDPSICSNSKNYTITGDSQSESYTWTTTNGLKIYKNGQYLSTYTGTETSLILANPSSASGLSEIKVVAHAQDYYIESEESIKQIWLGDPDPNDFSIIGLDNYGNSIDLGDGTFKVCENEYYTFQLAPIYNLSENHHRYGITDVDFYFDFNYTIVTEGYGWAYVYVNNIDEYSVGLVDVVGCSTINEFIDYEVVEGDCGYYFMSYSPNPANEYVDINLIEEKDVKDKTNKIKIKKDKNRNTGEIGDYLVQILDKNGTIRKTIQTNSMKTRISTKELEPGNYFLHFTIGDQVYKQQIVIY